MRRDDFQEGDLIVALEDINSYTYTSGKNEFIGCVQSMSGEDFWAKIVNAKSHAGERFNIRKRRFSRANIRPEEVRSGMVALVWKETWPFQKGQLVKILRTTCGENVLIEHFPGISRGMEIQLDHLIYPDYPPFETTNPYSDDKINTTKPKTATKKIYISTSKDDDILLLL